jgi:hypothetical protein
MLNKSKLKIGHSVIVNTKISLGVSSPFASPALSAMPVWEVSKAFKITGAMDIPSGSRLEILSLPKKVQRNYGC